jgi:cytochrome P450
MSLNAVFNFLGTPSWTQAACGAIGAAVVWNIISFAVSWYKLRHVPGPFIASFSNLWATWAAYTGRVPIIMDSEQKKYGNIFRVSPDAVMVSDPETIFQVQSARSPYTRGPWYRSARIDYRGDSMFTELDPSVHGKRKAILAAGFSGKSVAFLEAKIDKWIAALVGSIRAKVARGNVTIDINTLIMYCQVDMITDAKMGKEWGDLADETDKFDFFKINSTFLSALVALSLLPAARAIYTSAWFMKIFGPKTTDKGGLGAFLG